MIVYLNGSYLPAAAAQVSVFDGGYLYGDGIYTTLRLYRGWPLDLAAHHLRLTSQTSQLKIGFDLGLDDLRDIIAELVRQNDLTAADGRLRITVSRAGNSETPLPLSGLPLLPTTVTMMLSPVSPNLVRWQTNGIPVICLGPDYARGNFPELKTLNALATISALRQAAAADCPEALLTGRDGRLLEGAVSNLFLVAAGSLLTPRIEGGFLAGRTRERILEIAANCQVPVREETIPRRRLATADEVFVVSSVREVLPVITVDGQALGNGSPGPLTRRIQAEYQALIAQDLATQTD